MNVKTPCWAASKKHGPKSRLFLLLMDGNEHLLEESYDWIIQDIEPQIAVRSYMRRNKNKPDDLQDAVSEGKRQIMISMLCKILKKGFITVVWPEKEPPRSNKSTGHYDLRKCIVQLTDKGRDQIFSGFGVFKCMVVEMYHGLVSGRLKVATEYLGDQELHDVEEVDSNCVLV